MNSSQENIDCNFFFNFPFLMKMKSFQILVVISPMPVSLFSVFVDLSWIFLDHKKETEEKQFKVLSRQRAHTLMSYFIHFFT